MRAAPLQLGPLVVAVFSLALATGTVGAGGVERFWSSAKGGDFDDPANWIGPGAPAPEDTAVFGFAGIFTVNFPNDQQTDRVRVTRGLVTFDLTRSAYTLLGSLPGMPSIVIGNTGSDTGGLTVVGGTLQGGSTNVGRDAGAVGMLTVSGRTSHLLNEGQLDVGHQGAGLLDVIGAGAISSGASSIAAGAGSFGDAAVSGAGSAWDCDGALTVGKGGSGSLLIAAGGIVGCADAIIAQQLSSVGEVTVTGPGSSWIVDGSLDVGLSGFGWLTITDGASVSNQIFATVGAFPFGDEGAVGEVFVSGSASTWTVNGDLYVGFAGFGRWTLSGGGRVIVTGDLIRGSWLPASEVPQTVIELASSDDYAAPAITVAGMADGFDPRVDLLDGFVPEAGDRFVIASADVSLGTFNFDLPPLPPPLIWEVVQDANTVELRVGPLLADLNDDFVVNVVDLIIMLLAFGDCPDPPEGCPADLNEDGTVNRLDLVILLSEFG